VIRNGFCESFGSLRYSQFHVKIWILTTIDFSGDLQVSYCSSDQELYSIYVIEDDVEDED